MKSTNTLLAIVLAALPRCPRARGRTHRRVAKGGRRRAGGLSTHSTRSSPLRGCSGQVRAARDTRIARLPAGLFRTPSAARHAPRRHHVEYSWSMRDPQGEWQGFEIDLARQLACRSRCRPHDRARAVHPVHIGAGDRPHRHRRRGVDHAAARAGRRLQQRVRGLQMELVVRKELPARRKPSRREDSACARGRRRKRPPSARLPKAQIVAFPTAPRLYAAVKAGEVDGALAYTPARRCDRGVRRASLRWRPASPDCRTRSRRLQCAGRAELVELSQRMDRVLDGRRLARRAPPLLVRIARLDTALHRRGAHPRPSERRRRRSCPRWAWATPCGSVASGWTGTWNTSPKYLTYDGS